MQDLIDRQEAIDAMRRLEQEDIDAYGAKIREGFDADPAVKALKALPAVQRWIPCSERLPEDDTLMLVTYIDHRQDAGEIWLGWHEMENVWFIDGEEHGEEHSEERGNEVVAWMSLPEPYKEEDNE